MSRLIYENATIENVAKILVLVAGKVAFDQASDLSLKYIKNYRSGGLHRKQPRWYGSLRSSKI